MRDLRLCVRSLLKAPGYTSAAVVTLALAIGANSAIFSAVHTVLLTRTPLLERESIVICWGADRARDLAVVEVSYRNFEDWAAGNRSFTQIAAMGSSNWPIVLDGGGESVRLSYTGVSASFFETLGARPLLGRGFGADDDVPNASPVLVLNYTTWLTRFGADPHIIGTSLRLDNIAHTVVGVMPRGFDFPRGAELWRPVLPQLVASSAQWRTSALENVGVLYVLGRLRDGVTPALAAEDLNGLASRLERDTKSPRFGTSVVVTPLIDYHLGPVRPALWSLFGAVGILLLIACANVSGLMLARVSLRRRENAIRLALGATSTDIGRLWAIETTIITLVGGGIGLLAAHWIAAGIVTLAPDDLPQLAEVSIDATVGAFTLLLVLVTALLCGSGPVRAAGAANLVGALAAVTGDEGARRSFRGRSLMIVIQVGLAVVLLVAAGLIVRSFINLRQIDLGFLPTGVLTMTVEPRSLTSSHSVWFDEFLARVGELPDVEAAGAVALRPLALGPIGQETWIVLDGQPNTPDASKQNPVLNHQVATPGYFHAMRIALRRGRFFTGQDDTHAPMVAIVGESTARRLWPAQEPIGRRLAMPTFAPDGSPIHWRTVVGVVADVHYRGLDDPRLDVYDAALQSRRTAGNLVVRTSGDPLALAAGIQTVARRLDPRVVIDGVSAMDAIVARAIAPWRFSVWMFTLFAAFAFTLALVGLFSLVSLDVASRRHEFAVRVALGAQRRDIIRAVLVSAGLRVVAGLTLGLLAAVSGARAIQALLYEIEPLDPSTYATVVALILAMVAAASYLPARRAAAADPLALLRRH